MEDNVKENRAALENQPRINLHRFPIIVTKENGDLVLEGEAENVAANRLADEYRFDLEPNKLKRACRGGSHACR